VVAELGAASGWVLSHPGIRAITMRQDATAGTLMWGSSSHPLGRSSSMCPPETVSYRQAEHWQCTGTAWLDSLLIVALETAGRLAGQYEE
jgi:hypothetical protein